MKINNMNRFQMNPVNLDISRSRIKKPFGTKITLNSGKLVPFYVKEIVPGETLKLDYASVIRSITPAAPVMDNSFIDFYFFWVPHRLSTIGEKDWQKVCGENVAGYWAPNTESTLINTNNSYNIKDLNVSSLGSTSFKVAPQSLLDYLGIAVLPASRVGTGSGNSSGVINTLASRAYFKIWNEFFRDENTQPVLTLDMSKAGLTDTDSNSQVLPVNRFHDYFCSVLPAPQKGSSVLLPLGTYAPVYAGLEHDRNNAGLILRPTGNTPVRQLPDGDGVVPLLVGDEDEGTYAFKTSGATESEPSGATVSYKGYLEPVNLYTDLSAATAASVNELRNAFAIQRLLEKDARGGTRYFETLLAHFNVTNPDLVLQRPEYLSGKRVPLNITQVNQTSETSSDSPLGATGAFSDTATSDYAFTKSFGEYGYVIGVCCIRTSQSYSQGIPKHFQKTSRFHYYWPVFANLGEMPVLKKELYFGQSSSDNDAVFGYQEAWADYRYRYNSVHGYFNPDAGDTFLTAWTYTNNFNTYPTLNSDFMKQPKSLIDDTLAYKDSPYQFYMDLYFEEVDTLPMPLYSIPGLIDHH